MSSENNNRKAAPRRVFVGGCYCRALRYEASGPAIMKAQCHCRECQYFSGGGPNLFMGLPASGFYYVQGAPKLFARSDLDEPVTREFCAECGTHICNRRPGLETAVILKVGTLDEPAVFRGARAAIFTVDMQAFHHIEDGVPRFERLPELF
jgi:hypothetical protein